MKHFKMLGLAVWAVAAAMAIGGVGAAQATVLCETDKSACPEGESWKTGAEAEFSKTPNTTFQIETTEGVLGTTCAKGSAKGKLTNAGGASATVVAEVTQANLKFEECTNVVNVLTGGELEIHSIAGTNKGTVTAKNFVVTLVTFGFHCAYGAGSGLDLGTFTPGAGGTAGTLAINTIVSRVSEHNGIKFSIFCPASARWTASYTQTTATDLYVAEKTEPPPPSAGTVLCETDKSACPEGENWKAGAEASFSLASGTTSQIEDTTGGVGSTCSKGGVNGKISNPGGSSATVVANTAATDLTFAECLNPVKVLTGGEIEAHSIEGTNKGTITAKNLVITLTTFGLHCAYGAGSGIDLGTFTPGGGGTDGTLAVNAVVERISEHGGAAFSAFCPTSARWKATYTQTTSTDLYVAKELGPSLGGTVLCETDKSACPEGESWKTGAEAEFSKTPSTTFQIESTEGAAGTTCAKGSAKGKLTNAGGASATVVAEVTQANLKFEECVNVVNVLTGGELEIHSIAGTNKGTVTAKNFVVTLVTFGFHCAYGAGTGIDLGTFTPGAGGTDGTLAINAIVSRVSEHSGTKFSAFCPASARWTASYTQTTATDLYVSAA